MTDKSLCRLKTGDIVHNTCLFVSGALSAFTLVRYIRCMSKERIKQIITEQLAEDGMVETCINGVHLFRATQALPCAPAVYEPSVIAIVSGGKETVLDGARYVYDSREYMCCPMSMPVEAGTPTASPENPLLGVYIALDQGLMTELAIQMEAAGNAVHNVAGTTRGIKLARWDGAFTDALLRLVDLSRNPDDAAIIGAGRLRELYFAILKGEAGPFARQAFGPGNAIARSIAHASTKLDKTLSIDDMAQRAGMSRAAFHRKFKQATTMSPIQFVKSMRLNQAAMKIAQGMTVSEAAMDVGYVSASQFSREFKRMYGKSPRQWGDMQMVLPQ